ncbi:hypothetical protein EBR43_07310 [bacterium]|nr:hypothetical protein [bacterium]
MTKYKAKCFLGQSSGYVDIEVQASTMEGAKDQLKRIYHAEQILGLREVSSFSYSNIHIICFIILITLFINFTSIIFSIIFGLISIKILQLSLKNTNNKNIIILVVFLVSCFLGFELGNYVHQNYFNSKPVPELSHMGTHSDSNHATVNSVAEVPNVYSHDYRKNQLLYQ